MRTLLQTVLFVLHVIICIALIASILLQSGKSAGLSGSIAGGAETFFGKKKGMDEMLSKATMIIAILFGALALIMEIWYR